MYKTHIVYKPLLSKDVRTNILDLAVKKVGVGNVIMKMDNELHYFPVSSQQIINEDIQEIIKKYDLSLRNFGYTMIASDKYRQEVLNKVCKYYGVFRCLKHFDMLATKQKKYIHIIAKDSVYIKNKYNVVLKNLQPNLDDIIKNHGPIHLRAYGYRISYNKERRQLALHTAIKEIGKKRVYDRLVEISKYYQDNIIRDDIKFVNKI